LPIAGLKDYKVSVNGKDTSKIESDGKYIYLRNVKGGVYTCIVEVLEGSYVINSDAAFSTTTKTRDLKWNVEASSSREEGGWGLDKLIDGVTTSKPASKGYASKASGSGDSKEWIEVDLGEKRAIKSIVLYPQTFSKTADGKTAGFPVDMTIYIKTQWGTHKVIKTLKDIPNPDGKVYAIDLYTVVGFHEGRYIRFEVTKLGTPGVAEPGMYQLQLAEMEFVFDK